MIHFDMKLVIKIMSFPKYKTKHEAFDGEGTTNSSISTWILRKFPTSVWSLCVSLYFQRCVFRQEKKNTRLQDFLSPKRKCGFRQGRTSTCEDFDWWRLRPEKMQFSTGEAFKRLWILSEEASLKVQTRGKQTEDVEGM